MFEKVSKSFYRTPLHKLNYELFSKLNINLYIKRDDLYPISGGGNKGRKLEYIINNKVKKKYNALVTTGGSQSNHIRASLIRAKELGWKSHIIIHDHKPQVEETGNLKLTKLMADKVTYVDIKDVAVSMDNAISELKREGYNPLYIWGGGHCLEGTLAYHNAVIELSSQLKKIQPQYIFLASGTGATQAGLVSGAKQFFDDCKVIGISISRDAKKGKNEVYNSVRQIENHLGFNRCSMKDIYFDDSFSGGGYDISYKGLDEIIKDLAKFGIILDKTYTAKAFYGMIEYALQGKIKPNSNIIFWHTGGLLNFLCP